jgi:dephospho-CoA kinase
MNKLKIIGIAGTNTSGKDTVGKMLQERYGWLFVSVSDILRHELGKRGVAIQRENLHNLSAEWRREFGNAVLVDKAIDVFSTFKAGGLVIASIRNPGEVDRIHQLGGRIVWVDADPKIRYRRIHTRARGSEDQKTFEQFLAEEEAEMHSSGDAATLDMSAVKARADIFIDNNGNDVEAFKDAAAKTLGLPPTP